MEALGDLGAIRLFSCIGLAATLLVIAFGDVSSVVQALATAG
jgi:hypothetical protein